MTDIEVKKLLENLSEPFYYTFDFWIGIFLGLFGVIFSLLAYLEAKKAKQAAAEAGKTVKIQTITIELTEIAQRLDKLSYELTFSEARDLLNEVNRKLRRLIAPFQTNEDITLLCQNLKQALDEAKVALDDVRPIDEEIEQSISNSSVYFATQGHFSNISSLVAEIMGLFEKRTIEVTNK